MKACRWYVQDPETKGPTRRQRAKYAAQGGLPDSTIEGRGQEVGALLKPVVTSLGDYSRWVHVRQGTILTDSNKIEAVQAGTLSALESFFEALLVCRNVLSEVVREEVGKAAMWMFTEQLLASIAADHSVRSLRQDPAEVLRIGPHRVEMALRLHFELDVTIQATHPVSGTFDGVICADIDDIQKLRFVEPDPG